MTSNAAHWRAVHMAGDKSPPIYLTDRRVRRSVGTATRVVERGRKDVVTYE
jgi:hypothetical protein